jgi:hypothetical protein
MLPNLNIGLHLRVIASQIYAKRRRNENRWVARFTAQMSQAVANRAGFGPMLTGRGPAFFA